MSVASSRPSPLTDRQCRDQIVLGETSALGMGTIHAPTADREGQGHLTSGNSPEPTAPPAGAHTSAVCSPPAGGTERIKFQNRGEEPTRSATVARPSPQGRNPLQRWNAVIAHPATGLASETEDGPSAGMQGVRHTSRSERPLNGPCFVTGRSAPNPAARRADATSLPRSALRHPYSEPPRLVA